LLLAEPASRVCLENDVYRLIICGPEPPDPGCMAGPDWIGAGSCSSDPGMMGDDDE
jgi:hypothetical protein